MTKIYCEKISLNWDENNSFIFTYPYNQNTTFLDLLEFMAVLIPELNICPCYNFKYIQKNKSDKNEKNIDISNENKIIKYKNLLSNLYPNINKCTCNSTYKNFFNKSKKTILDYIIKVEANQNNKQETTSEKDFIQKEKDLQKKINELAAEKESLNNEINSLKNKIENLEKEIKIGKKKEKLLELAVNGDIETIKELEELGIKGENLKPKINNIKIDPKSNQIVGNEIFNKETFIDFYDVIIDIKSIKDINKGWPIKMSQKAKSSYKDFKNQEIIKIGVIGNSDKGKSFLLSKISKINLPSGTSIRTEGLSIKYPDLKGFENRKIALLDSAGLETPVLKVEEDNNNLEKKSEKDLFKEKSREKLITELFLQNYIINNSDILIVVVGILTYSEQKLLNRIKTEIKRAKINKPLFIIHNLITYTSVEQVEDYINNFLLKSLTFNLELGHKISTKTETKKGTYYYEKNTEPKIYHLIFANEGSDAGKHYNQYTLEFLENSFQNVTDLKTFDVIETVKNRFIEISKEIIEKTNQTKENDNKSNKTIKNDKDIFDNSNAELIKLNNPKEIILKKCLIDELGFSNLKANGFEPTYNYYKKDNTIIVRVEAPGNCKLNSEIDYAGEYTIIKLNGEKKKDKEPEKIEDNLFNSREIGDFSLDIPLKTDDFLLSNDIPNISDKKGVFILEYKLSDKNKTKEYEVDDEL